MRCRSIRYTGAGTVAVAVCAAVALSGCSSGSGSGSQGKKAPSTAASASGGTTASPSPTGAAATTPTTGGSASATASATASGAGDGVQGVWLATEGASKVQLVLGEGKAGLTSTSLCGGTYTGTSPIHITVICMDGNKDRTSGEGSLSSDGKTLKVTWDHGPTDVFLRTGLPGD